MGLVGTPKWTKQPYPGKSQYSQQENGNPPPEYRCKIMGPFGAGLFEICGQRFDDHRKYSSAGTKESPLFHECLSSPIAGASVISLEICQGQTIWATSARKPV